VTPAPAPIEQSEVAFEDAPGVIRQLRVHRAAPAGAHTCAFVLPGLALPGQSGDGFAPALGAELAARGIDVVRGEPRHTGAGAVALAELDWHSEIESHAAALRATRAQSWVEPHRLYLLGLSLGGVVAPVLARRAGPIAGIASWAATARHWPAYAEDNLRRQLLWSGVAHEAIHRRLLVYRRWHELLVGTELDAAEMLALAPDLGPFGVTAAGFMGRPVAFWRQLCRFDAPASYRGLGCPLLAVRGSSDFKCHPEDLSSVASAARAAGMPVRSRTLDGLDHGLRRAPSAREACQANGGQGPAEVAALADLVARWLSDRDGPEP
jgi:uncharacterized protein